MCRRRAFLGKKRLLLCLTGLVPRLPKLGLERALGTILSLVPLPYSGVQLGAELLSLDLRGEWREGEA